MAATNRSRARHSHVAVTAWWCFNKESLSTTMELFYGRLAVFSGYSGFLHQ